MIGTSLSHYKITSKLGEGGMGEVWRAEDTRLGRDVALKMLPDALVHDPERLARFEREARVLASLSHPNIAGIFGLEEDQGRPFLVMEVAEGETLAERIARGRIAPEGAVRIAVQIAEALEAAHAKGIVHRDLKPANVKLASDGRVKVLDFGLAKALTGGPDADSSAVDLSMSPTLTQAMTGKGVLLGTAGYMSPEQARAQPADRRSDIWAFGCVLFEMLTGERTFKGDTATDILGAIVHKEPALEQLPAGLSPRLRRLIERCLRKDAGRRLQAIGDARVALQDWLEHPEEEPEEVRAVEAGRRWLLPLAAAVGGALLAWLAAALWLGRSTPEPEPVRRFEQTVEGGRLFTDGGPPLALSRDGRRLAFNVMEAGPSLNLYLRSLDQLESASVVAGGSRGSFGVSPFFSPDGQWLAYFSGTGLVKRTQGGAPIQLVEVETVRGGDWSASGSIVYSHDGEGDAAEGLFLIPAAGGERVPLTSTKVDENVHEHHRWPQWLPGDRAVVFTNLVHGAERTFRIEAVEVEGGERKLIHQGGYFARYVATGHLLFANEGTIYALAFDPRRLEASGAPMPVLQGVAENPGLGSASFSVADDGLLAYVGGSDALREFPIVWTDRQGQTQSLLDTRGVYGGPMLSQSGDRLAVCIPRGDDWDVWVYDIERGVFTRLTFGAGYDADVVWSPDGREIAFTSDREDGVATIFRTRSDGSGEAVRVLEPGRVHFPSPLSWHPDGRRLLVVASKADGAPQELWLLDVESGEIEPFVSSERVATEGSFSPDGRWVAYRSNESGAPQVYVRSVSGEGKWQISSEGGAQPRWSRDGRELFYRSSRGMMRAEVDTGGAFRASRPEFLFEGPLGDMLGVTVPGYNFSDYDVAPDGRFVVLPRRLEGDTQSTKLQFVTGWLGELRALTGSSGR
jgi:serine/threonine-protein kinase